jgi:hypothetical protein
MIDVEGRVGARLKSEYRGPPVSSRHVWDDLITHEFSPDDIFGVFVLEGREGTERPKALLSAIQQCALKPEFDQAVFESVINFPIGKRSLRREGKFSKRSPD